jgi:hypothetical protein
VKYLFPYNWKLKQEECIEKIDLMLFYDNEKMNMEESQKKKRGNGLSWMMRRNREDMEGMVGSSEPSKRYAPIPLTCTRRESELLPSLEICGSAIAHLSVPHILRRRERCHNPSRPILFTQRCMRWMVAGPPCKRSQLVPTVLVCVKLQRMVVPKGNLKYYLST